METPKSANNSSLDPLVFRNGELTGQGQGDSRRSLFQTESRILNPAALPVGIPCQSTVVEAKPVQNTPEHQVTFATKKTAVSHNPMQESPPIVKHEVPPEEEESLVDSQPISFSNNPFLIANQKGKGKPAEAQILSGPPVGYGKRGLLQTSLYSKGPCSEPTGVNSISWEAPCSPTTQPASINFLSSTTPKENTSTKPGVIHPLSRVCQNTSPANQDGRNSPNPFQHGPAPSETLSSPRAPSPLSPDKVPANVKQAYKTFAAVPTTHPVLEQQEVFLQRNNVQPKPSPEVASPSPSGLDSPEQRSFRDRQKYFEIDVKQHLPDSKPKPRVSLVAEDDLKKMREEEVRRIEQRTRELSVDEEEEEEDLDKQMAAMKAHSKVVIEGVEYKIERLDNRSTNSPSAGESLVDEKRESQRNSLEDGFRPEQRPNSMTGLSPVYPGESGAPIRTAKAERRYQERMRMQSPELHNAQDKDLSPAEKRAQEAEKRAMWRAARMKSLEQDALKAQMVIAKSKEGKRRNTLDQLAESPSPAPTPSPTQLEDYSPRSVTSPGRLSPDLKDDIQYMDDTTNSAAHRGEKEAEGHVSLPTTSALEEMALYSNKRKLRHGRRSLETAVPT